jgi:hypothetical protein
VFERHCWAERVSAVAHPISIRSLFGSTLLPCAVIACTGAPDPNDPIACTEEFRSWSVVVVDGAGDPVDGLTLQVVRASTGEQLPYGDAGYSAGSYRIMDDGMAASIRIEGEMIEASSAGGSGIFDAAWEFGADVWRCHVEKLSGPDSVTALISR